MDGSCGGDLFFQGWTAGRPGHGMINIDHGSLPTLTGFPAVLVAVVISVTVLARKLAT